MASVIESLPPSGRVALIRLRSLGDCVLTTPALEILKQTRPDLRVAVVVEDRFRALFEGNPDVELLLPPKTALLRRWRPQLCLNLHGGNLSARLTALSRARFRAGFSHFRFPFIYNEKIPRAQEILEVNRKVHTAEHLASAIFYLGASHVEIPRARLFAETVPADRPYAVIHAVASHPAKTWPADRFLAVAEHLKHHMNLEPVFIAGNGDNLSLFESHRRVVGAPLSRTKSLLRSASLFVGNDSGPAHMAAAFGVPMVVIFGPSDVEVWRPWKAAGEVLRPASGTDIRATQTGDVISAIDRLQVHA